jgi:hypothetical protein
MDNLRQLLVAIAALTLLFSVVSGASPSYFATYSAYADEHEDDDNSGSSETEEEEHDDAADNESEQTVGATFGQNSDVKLEIDDEIEDEGSNAGMVEAKLEVETEDGDLPDGEYAVSMSCTSPALDKTFDSPLVVADGDGKFEAELALTNGATYEACHVTIGDMVVDLETFAVQASPDDDDDADEEEKARGNNDEEDDEEENDLEDDDNRGRSEEHRAGVRADDDGVEIKVETSVELADGTYDVLFTCAEPETSMTIEDALEVEGGEAELDAEIDLAEGTYTDCKVSVGDTVIASFDSINAAEDSEQEVEEKRKEKRRDLVTTIDAVEDHKRRVNANPASTGDYEPGTAYNLTASGAGIPYGDDDEEELAETTSNTTETSSNSTSTDPTNSTSTESSTLEVSETTVEVEIDMGVWKSNKALVLLNILGGTIEAGGEEYTVELGYALYSVNHNVIRVGAFVSDEDGNIYKLKLRGSATGEEAIFPAAPGESIEMVFEGNAGPARNSFDHWYLDLEGKVSAE